MFFLKGIAMNYVRKIYYEYPIKTILVSSSKNITGSFRLLIKSEETQQITMFYLSVVSAALDSCITTDVYICQFP